MIGLIWSQDINYAFSDLLIKLPLLATPLIIITSLPLEKRDQKWILNAFIAACLTGSFASILYMMNIFQVDGERVSNASLFISHIRFSLMVVMSIIFSVYLILQEKDGNKIYHTVFYLLSIAWLSVFLFFLKSLSGIVIFIVLILFVAFKLTRSIRESTIRFMLYVFIITIPLFVLAYISNSVKKFYTTEEVDFKKLDEFSLEGNRYVHNYINKERENGNYVWIYVCPDELKTEWEKRSNLGYNSKSESGDLLKFTLIRYLTSKGLRKDSV